jgi:putative MATE family efflux protein
MKKTLWESYIAGLEHETPGESYKSILRYFLPEYITALLTYSLITLFDAQCIAQLDSPCMYATMSISKTLLHCITKIAEGVSVGTMVICGIAHGRGDKHEIGKSIGSALILTLILGGCISLIVGLCPVTICSWLGTSQDIISTGVPYLQLRAISIFLMFIFCTMSGFLRGLKKNNIPTRCHVLGTGIFILSDYLLVLGKYGFPQLCLIGSAVSSLLQYGVMIAYAGYYIISEPEIRNYLATISLRSYKALYHLITLSWPVMCDKAVLAVGKLVLARSIAPMGKIALGSFGIIHDIEMFVFVPAIAFAQVVTFLVSNELGTGNIEGVKYTIKKVLFLSTSFVACILCICLWQIQPIVNWFDVHHHFSALAIPAFRIISMLVLCDVTQVILAGALRGIAQVHTVLRIRSLTLIFFCAPVAYIASHIVFYNDFVKFITIYSSFYVGNGIMAIWYIYLLRTDRWKQLPW